MYKIRIFETLSNGTTSWAYNADDYCQTASDAAAAVKTWCEVLDEHVTAGMLTKYKVTIIKEAEDE